MTNVTQKEIDDFYNQLKTEIEERGYNLNPNIDFTKKLIKSLLINRKRYGYDSCPCRLSKEDKKEDLDIICPCDYRDQDLNEFGACYCALYVNEKFNDKKQVPERRNLTKTKVKKGEIMKSSKMPVWRCKVCGYLCAREHAPDKCPICGVSADRFEKFEQ